MGKAAVVEFEGNRYTLSLISWGVIKRTMKGAAAKVMMGVPFVPRYELAVWQGPASLRAPDLLCYFPDEQTAAVGFDNVREAVKEGGLSGQPIRHLLNTCSQRNLFVAPFCALGREIDHETHKLMREYVGAERSLRDSLAKFHRKERELERPQGLIKSAIEGNEARKLLFEILDEFEADKKQEEGRSVDAVIANPDEGLFYHQQLPEWISAHYGAWPFVDELLIRTFPTADRRSRLDEGWPAIVASYEGKLNTKDVLADKALKLADYVLFHCHISIAVLMAFKNTDPEFKCRAISEELEREIMIEESALWLRMVDEAVYPRQYRDQFMDYFVDEIGLTLGMQGFSADAIRVLRDRAVEYGSYKEVIRAERPYNGTVLWEAGKHLMMALGMAPGITFQTLFERNFIDFWVLALIPQLLSGRTETIQTQQELVRRRK
jgi:hypothetical protein